MSAPDVLSLLNIATSVLLVPLVSSLWALQGRLSKIEGQLSIITEREHK